MTRQLFIGLYTEGTTDNRFLESVVKRAFEETAFESLDDFEIYLEHIYLKEPGLSYTERVIRAAQSGIDQFGITILCLHRDADGEDDSNVFQHSINPALDELSKKNEKDYCKTTAIVVPVRMIESWLLADKELFKKEIGTEKTDSTLGISRHPESIANPKEVIKEAIRIVRQDMAQRRRKDLTIKDIYMPLGQKISVDKLNNLSSYRKFRESVKAAFRLLNYLN
jgi:hypothetical protein